MPIMERSLLKIKREETVKGTDSFSTKIFMQAANKMRHEYEEKNFKNREEDSRWNMEENKKVLEAKPLNEELGDSFYADSDSSEDEGLPDYKIGGYHPVHVGEVFKERYVIIQKLGWGHFSTVWLAKDKKYDTYVALKVQKSAQHYIEAAYDEVEILDQVSTFWRKKEWQDSLKHYYKDNPKKLKEVEQSSKYCHTVQLLNAFMHHGPNGKHYVMVFEILGVNLLEIIKRYDYKGVPLHLVRELGKQCLIGLDYMNRICKLIHTDLKPENVVISLSNKELRGIRDNGVLKTTKMYHQDEKKIARAVAGAHDNIILSSRAEKEETKKGPADIISHSEMNSKDWSEMTAKEKKNYKKKRRKRVKKYIAQGRLPENYDQLQKEEKDKLYEEVRALIQQENLKRERLGSHIEEVKNEEVSKVEDDKEPEIKIDAKDIDLAESVPNNILNSESTQLCESTQMTTNTDNSKQKEQDNSSKIEAEQNQDSKENDPLPEEKKSSTKK